MDAQNNRQMLDQPASVPPPVGVPPEKPAALRADEPTIVAKIDELLKASGVDASTFNARMVRDLIQTSLKLIPDGRDTGELKLISTAVKEMRYAYRVFGQYREPHKVSIFGSARTPADHPDYAAAREFGTIMAKHNWMVITGAGNGIMKAGHEGPGKQASFGVAIRLPFETTANEVIAGDDKLIHFRYFFTRKLMFLSQAEAVALFPGGFGTLDEAFEALTLIQTGKSSMIPVVMCEGKDQTYWEQFDQSMRTLLLSRGWISPEDMSLYTICKSPEAAAKVIVDFYRNYHSSRYVKDDLVIRIKKPLKPVDVERLTDEFRVLIKTNSSSPPQIVQRGSFLEEEDHLDLPRLSFPHTRYKFGMIRQLIDRINECEPA